MTVVINEFVTRQTTKSEYSSPIDSHSWDDVLAEIKDNFDKAYTGPMNGVLYVPLNPNNYLSAVAVLEEGDELIGEFKRRRDDEDPRMSFRVKKGKAPAKEAFAVLYSSTKLEESDRQLEPVEGNWECISLNAAPMEGEMPIDPTTLMHNHFGSSGGSATGLGDEAFVKQLRESFIWWRDKAMSSK
tara:strand:- start:240 stop:797 length:558 start_codon:yes stop_codon:yes gene_type:complete